MFTFSPTQNFCFSLLTKLSSFFSLFRIEVVFQCPEGLEHRHHGRRHCGPGLRGLGTIGNICSGFKYLELVEPHPVFLPQDLPQGLKDGVHRPLAVSRGGPRSGGLLLDKRSILQLGTSVPHSNRLAACLGRELQQIGECGDLLMQCSRSFSCGQTPRRSPVRLQGLTVPRGSRNSCSYCLTSDINKMCISYNKR